jgi:crotonobetaine/carnitine-CoA ligase
MGHTTVTLPQLLVERADANPDRLFAQDVGGRSLTYGDALTSSRRWAAAYQAAGVAASDRVATMLPHDIRALEAWLGAITLGAIEVPVNFMYRGAMLVHALATVGAEVFVVSGRFLPSLADVADRLTGLKRVVVIDPPETVPELPFDVIRGDAFLDVEPAADCPIPNPWDVATVIFTSGTTGPSKAVTMSWAHLEAMAVRPWPVEDLDQDDAFYVITPAFHLGSKALPYLAAILNARVVIPEAFGLDRFWDDVRQYGITTTGLVGTIARYLESQPPAPDDATTSLRNIVMAPLVPDLDGFKERFGVRICSAYSMTEINTPFASEGWDVANQPWQSCGRLKGGWPGIEVRIVDDHDSPVPTGEVGELVVRADEPWTMTNSYFGMPAETARVWRNGWFHTGDGFKVDEDGWYYFVDRLKDTIRRRGENISSFEVEAQLNEHPAIAMSAAVAVPAEFGEDEVKAVVVLMPGAELDPKDLIEWLIPRMARFMIPRYVEFVDELPQTETNRVKKAVLREQGVGPATWDREAAGIALPK